MWDKGNDNLQILITPDELIAHYWEAPETPNPEILQFKALDEFPNSSLGNMWHPS
jgi:hypothetical protein